MQLGSKAVVFERQREVVQQPDFDCAAASLTGQLQPAHGAVTSPAGSFDSGEVEFRG